LFGLQQIKHFFNTTLWQELPAGSHVLWRGVMQSLRVVYIVIRELMTGELNLRAMSLVFTTLISLVPLIAVAFSVLKAFGIHNQIEPALLGLLAPLGERGVDITANIIGFVENVKVGVLGSVGVAMLFYTIIALVKKVENAFNFVWRVKRPRTLARRFTDYLSVIMIGPVLVFTGLAVAATALNADIVQQLQGIEPFGTLIIWVGKVVPYLMIIVAFTFLYTFIPNTKVQIKTALIGATVAGVLWVMLGTVFASFVVSSSNYTAIYSSFAILFFFMIWLYLAWFILLVGSQVAFYIQHPKLVQVGGHHEALSPRMQEQEGLKLMTVIAQQFQQEKPALTVMDLERETGLTADNIMVLVDGLEQGGFLLEVEGSTPAYVPARDTANMAVDQVLACLRTAGESGIVDMATPVTPELASVLDKLTVAQKAALADLSLRDLSLGKSQNG
jgi:membrane protein